MLVYKHQGRRQQTSSLRDTFRLSHGVLKHHLHVIQGSIDSWVDVRSRRRRSEMYKSLVHEHRSQLQDDVTKAPTIKQVMQVARHNRFRPPPPQIVQCLKCWFLRYNQKRLLHLFAQWSVLGSVWHGMIPEPPDCVDSFMAIVVTLS